MSDVKDPDFLIAFTPQCSWVPNHHSYSDKSEVRPLLKSGRTVKNKTGLWSLNGGIWDWDHGKSMRSCKDHEGQGDCTRRSPWAGLELLGIWVISKVTSCNLISPLLSLYVATWRDWLFQIPKALSVRLMSPCESPLVFWACRMCLYIQRKAQSQISIYFKKYVHPTTRKRLQWSSDLRCRIWIRFLDVEIGMNNFVYM
jgi:hypothetical protein